MSGRFPWILSAAAAAAVVLALPWAAPLDAADEGGDPEVAAFLEDAEARLLDLMIQRERAMWVQDNFITHDTDIIAARASEALMAFIAEKATEAARFTGQVSAEQRRKLDLLRLWIDLPAPADPARRGELAAIASGMQSAYGKGEYCSPLHEGRCLDLDALSDVLATSRDPALLLDAWTGWRTVSVPMKDDYARFVELGNAGARDLGFADVGAMWRSRYDMDPEAFQAEVDRLWAQVRPLYVELHTYVRSRLQGVYGEDLVPDRGPIPAHLLGNMWAQEWQSLAPILVPEGVARPDLDAALVATGWDERQMVEKAEAFFTSIGLPELPETFYERSLFTKPADRDVVCHASAWDVDFDEDVRIKMCIRRRYDDLAVVHHELGHVYYYWTVRNHSALFRDDAMDAFNEAIGDTISLSLTPSYLRSIGLLAEDTPVDDTGVLLERALGAVAFLPFGLVVDRWRWDVFAGEVPPDDYTAHWWTLVEQYQGVVPPVPRTSADFDPGAKYHVPANVPYVRYFLSTILQYQFHRALCREIGHQGPLHECSIYGHQDAGERLEAMMALGATKPWPDALEVLTGEREMDATAIIEYYAPLMKWLRKQNKGEKKGW